MITINKICLVLVLITFSFASCQNNKVKEQKKKWTENLFESSTSIEFLQVSVTNSMIIAPVFNNNQLIARASGIRGAGTTSFIRMIPKLNLDKSGPDSIYSMQRIIDTEMTQRVIPF